MVNKKINQGAMRKWVSLNIPKKDIKKYAEAIETVKSQPDEMGTAVCSVKAGLTINLGEFESARIECGVSVPVPCLDEFIELGFSKAWKVVEEQLIAKSKDITNIKNNAHSFNLGNS